MPIERIEAWQAARGPNDPSFPPPIGSSSSCLTIIGFIVVALAVFAGVEAVFKNLPRWLTALIPYLSSFWFKLIVTVIVLALGILFYTLKKKLLLLYATIELGAAAGTAFYNGPFLVERPTQSLLAVMSALYITVRALDNMSKWRKDHSGAKEK